MNKKDRLIHYENPPVIEVVCGIQFQSLKNLRLPHFGLLWERFKDEYPDCREVSPLAPVIERFEKNDEEPKIEFEVSDTPPLPRVWFIHADNTGIIQLQRDRFLHNWRKYNAEDEYPRYPTVIKRFEEHLTSFMSFLNDNNLGTIQPLQYEMTYVNHIPKGRGWKTNYDIGSLLPDFKFRILSDRFLPEPEKINWRTSFLLPDNQGRLHVTIRRGASRETLEELIILDLTVRGIGINKSYEKMWEWFDLAREWIVYGFADMTSKEVQKKVWKLKG